MSNKVKPHKGLKKRVKLTKTGKIKHRAAGKSHRMSGKTGKRRRHLRVPRIMDESGAQSIKRMLGVG